MVIFTNLKEDYKIKFLLQALKNKKVIFDGIYKRLGEECDYDIYD